MAPRRHMSLQVKLDAALIALGLDPADVDWDHAPSLAMRPVDESTGDTIPPSNDPRYIVPRARAAHRAKTFGDGSPLSGDVQKIRKMQRVEKDYAAFRARVLAKVIGEPPAPKSKRAWPKRRFCRPVSPRRP